MIRAMPKRKRFLLLMSSLREGGVGWSQTFINHCFDGIFAPFFDFRKFPIIHGQCPKSLFEGLGGWLHKVGSIQIVPNSPFFPWLAWPPLGGVVVMCYFNILCVFLAIL